LDPRRVKPLIDLIFSNSFDPNSDSFFTESKKLAFVNEVFVNFSWRMHPMIIEYLELYYQNLGNAYKSIRDTLGKLLSNLLYLEWHPSSTNIDEVIKSPSNLAPVENPQIQKMISFIISELESSRLQNNLSKYQNLSKAGN
jgi:hypothetical protein